MTSVGWMVALSVTTGAAAALAAPGSALEIVAGMIGPLAAAATAWWVTVQTYRRDPQTLTGVMFKAFAAKMVFFAAYVVFAVKGLMLRPVPFVISFTTYFIALHLTEAIWLRRMFAGSHRASD